MNERIRELARQAGYSKDYLAIGLPNNMEKFAELIVRECARVASDYDGAHYIGTEIEQHFGVKE
jgi:hypothetical protein